MDLLTYLRDDLASVRSKLTASVIEMVPAQFWPEQVDGGGSSITHIVLHLARHQDLAVQTAVLDREPLFATHRGALGLSRVGDAAGLSEREDPAVTARVDQDALLAYVAEVFDASSDWLGRVGGMAMDSVPATSKRLRVEAGLSVDEVPWLHRMWDDKPVWWLVQWPVIGHGHGHVAEAISVRNRLGLSPF